MLVVDPSSSRCDICLDPFEWNSTDRTPHIINCGHVFCAECLHQVFPTRCPLCRELFEPSEVRKLYVEPIEVRKLYVEPSEIRKLHVESCSDDDKEEVILLKQLISVHDSSEEEILRLRIRVDTWLAARTLDEQSPLRRARDALLQYQQLKQKRNQDRRKIKTLERAARHLEITVQENATRKEAEAAIMEQTLRSQVAEQQAQIAQLRAELDKKQAQIDRSRAKKTVSSKPLPLPKIPVSISNPLPTPPRLLHVSTRKPGWPVDSDYRARGNIFQLPRLPILEREDGFENSEDNAAYYTCQTAPYARLDEDDEPLSQRPFGSTYC